MLARGGELEPNGGSRTSRRQQPANTRRAPLARLFFRNFRSMKLNLPNLITLSRIPLMFLIVWFMFCGWPGAATLAFALFVLSAIGDWLDGYLARRQNLVSNFGKFMDALTDKILVIGVIVALVAKYWDMRGRATALYFLVLVLLTLCREFLVSGMRMVAATQGLVVAAERSGKIKTIVQLVAVSLILLVPMLETDIARLAGAPIPPALITLLDTAGLALFTIATLLAVSSGASYMLKYRKVFVENAPQN
jgi:CDP-diacylglycerol--glycerol-3-phosphate 3-phosphatidyltransferase